MTLTDLIINMMKSSRQQLEKMDIAAVAKKYHQSETDIKFLRDNEINNK